jgi:transposase
MGICDSLGVVHAHIVEGSVNATVFEHFLIKLHEKLLPRTEAQGRKTTLIMDNASIHQTPSIQHFFEIYKYQTIYSSPYSPELNPIEYVFGFLKGRLRIPTVVSEKQDVIKLYVEQLISLFYILINLLYF